MANKKQTYEQALARLEEIVELIEDENTTLQDAVKLYKEGNKLSVFCSEGLMKMEEEISVLKHTKGDNFRLESFQALEEDDYEQ